MGRRAAKVAPSGPQKARRSVQILTRRKELFEQSGDDQRVSVPTVDVENAFPPSTMIVERRIKLVTEQHNIPKPPQMEGYPMKEWTVEVYILDEAGKEKPARCFQKVVYNLHPSFENPVQTFHEPPFKCTNEGWGEFEMTIDCYTTEKGGKQSILHDLNFASPTYENIHTIQFKNPSQALQAILRETGPLPTDEDRKARKVQDTTTKKKKTFDIEKMADVIPRLNEDDLLHIIQLIHDNKSDDTYIVNNPDAGEFSIDLYTMPDNLCRVMWDFLLQSPEGHRLR
ncbi:transcription initiation factor subunit [Niveomyces insectorum RCEF 264]|uniref:Transcription initiation factor subunit n=1 Tax=Niveomyces insectorum RCEF 264 TaxID=1081102 RepID=A0A167WT85_9HYPO|nr:transcription initiation factor subunit [Niveomyces insectorum RCEF 264]